MDNMKNMSFLQYTKGLILGFFVMSSVAVLISFLGLMRHGYFRTTFVLSCIAYCIMLYSIAAYCFGKDNGLLFWASGFNCLAWTCADAFWLLINGFNISSDKDMLQPNNINFGLKAFWFGGIFFVSVLSFYSGRKLSRKVGAKTPSKEKISLYGVFVLIAIVAFPSILQLIEQEVPTSLFKYLYSTIALLCFFAFEAVGLAFYYFRKSESLNV